MPLYPFDKPIKSLYFRSFVVFVLFARFHFKVIRKSLYLERFERISIPFEQLAVERHTNGCTFQNGKPLGDSVRVGGHLFFENCFSCEDLTIENFRL